MRKKFGLVMTSLVHPYDCPPVRTQSHNANVPVFVWREVAWRDAFTKEVTAKNPFHCSRETGASFDTKAFEFASLSGTCASSATHVYMSETMDYNKLNSTPTFDLLSHIYKNHRIANKRKSSKVYEVERLIAKREGAEVSKQIQLSSHLFNFFGWALFTNSRSSEKLCVSYIFQSTEYLVKWSGFSKYESTWEASDDISDDCIWLVLWHRYNKSQRYSIAL